MKIPIAKSTKNDAAVIYFVIMLFYLIKINYAKTFSAFSLFMVCITIIFAVIFEINPYPEIRGLIQRVVFISTLSWVQVAYFRMLLQK